MKEFLRQYGGYFIGILFTPIIWKIIEVFKNKSKGGMYGKRNIKRTTKNK